MIFPISPWHIPLPFLHIHLYYTAFSPIIQPTLQAQFHILAFYCKVFSLYINTVSHFFVAKIPIFPFVNFL